jgi:prepilin-type N-terminal cleavage/methylation domain-containing protein/prepilin-type processing-associated H-X9-DG protein
MKRFWSQQGMSLIELLIVVSVISMLMALLAPAFQNIQEWRKSFVCMNNLRQIGTAMNLYANDHNNLFPQHYVDGHGSSGDWRTRADAYMVRHNRIKTRNSEGVTMYRTEKLADSKVWWCPRVEKIPDGDGDFFHHYGLNPFATLNYSEWALRRHVVPNPSKTIIVTEHNRGGTAVNLSGPISHSEKGRTEHRISHYKGKGANYLFVDGHVEHIRGDQGYGAAYHSSLTYQQKMWRWW